VDESIRQPKKLLPTLEDYIHTETTQCLVYCSETSRGDVIILQINHTGASESANKMLKGSLLGTAFTGIHNPYPRNHALKAAAAQIRSSRQFRKEHFLQKDFEPELSRPIMRCIDQCILRS
jgi:hypothetical protein